MFSEEEYTSFSENEQPLRTSSNILDVVVALESWYLRSAFAIGRGSRTENPSSIVGHVDAAQKTSYGV